MAVAQARKPTRKEVLKFARSRKSDLSQERVVDSDSDADGDTPKTINDLTNKPAAITRAPPTVESSDTSSSEESDDEPSSQSSESLQQQAPLKESIQKRNESNGVKRKTSDVDESTESSDSDESVEEAPPQAKRPKTTIQTRQTVSHEATDDANRGQSHSTTSTGQPVPAASVRAYIPPTGYSALEAQTSDTATSPLWQSTEGKTVWHIVVPSSVSLQSVAEISLDAMRGKAPLVQHKGIDYVLKEDDTRGGHPTIAALSTPNGIKFAPAAVERRLDLQPVIELPKLSKRQISLDSGSAAAADIGQAAIATVRPQPKGLRMRYKPPGFGAGDAGTIGPESDSSDGEEVSSLTARPTLQFPKALGAHGASTSAEADGGAKTGWSRKQKSRRNEQATTDMAKNENTRVPDGAPRNNSLTSKDMRSKVEKMRKKEAKRSKREAKRRSEEPSD